MINKYRLQVTLIFFKQNKQMIAYPLTFILPRSQGPGASTQFM